MCTRKSAGWLGFSSLALVLLVGVVPARADALNCRLDDYHATPGLTAAVADDVLALTWDGTDGEQVRLRLVIERGTPTIRDLAVRRTDGKWRTLATNVTPEYRVVSGIRRITNQQLWPLRQMGAEITQEILDRYKWEAFWDAPLYVPGADAAHGHATPPPEPFLDQPGLPRKPEEVERAEATFRTQSCSVETNGARITVTFPGVELGVFAGRLEYTVFKGTNLIRQSVVAKTDEPSVAYKYDAGWKGLPVVKAARVVWDDHLHNERQSTGLAKVTPGDAVTLKAAHRLAVAENETGSIATFPPPHTFFWAREVETNLGYVWYRKDDASSYALGVRQAEGEEDPEHSGAGDIRQNFALYSARPGTWQRMPVLFYVTGRPAAATIEAALAFTRNDRFKALPGYQVMATHFHSRLTQRLDAAGDEPLPDLELMKAAGVNIFAPIDGGRGGEDRLENLAAYYDAARKHSDGDFLIMPNEEDTSGYLGGHSDFILSRPVYWKFAKRGDPFVTEDPKYGKVYAVAGPHELMEMARLENILVYMPHPRSKGSTGWPDANKDSDTLRHPNYRGFGWRWGMGRDGSEIRLCEYRCLPVFNDMNNWVADIPTPPKYTLAISETYRKAWGDDIYANNPVNYVKLDRVPPFSEFGKITEALQRGDYFVTSGEVLIPSYEVRGTSTDRTIVADVEWTFPLDFVEVVWGDGERVDREIVSTTDMPPFGSHRFEIPFEATGKKWMRFAAWDSMGNGAMVQPIKLEPASGMASNNN